MTAAGTQVRTEYPGQRVLELRRCALILLGGPGRGREQTVDREVFRIGKSGDNDLILPDETVSRHHCEIVREARGYLLRDLESTNGTLLDGAEIREATLAPGAIITVGKVELKVRAFTERIELVPSESTRFGQAVAQSVAMREIFGLLERLAPTDVTVLLTGEPGTGKEVLARGIHGESPRAGRPFVAVDCGAAVGSIERELFGRGGGGSITSGSAQQQGAFELANGGTLFLDAIGELPLDVQPMVLRALERRTVRRVGGGGDVRVDIRVVAASDRDLQAEVARGKLREDLYLRLAVVPIEVPPLRERPEDVPMLVDAFLPSLPEGGSPFTLSRDARDALVAHDWPGNVRELRDVVERLARGAPVTGQGEARPSKAPFAAKQAGFAPGAMPPFDASKSYRQTKSEWEEVFEKRYVRWLLERHGGNISAAAREADMDRKYLHKLAKRHDLHPSDRK